MGLLRFLLAMSVVFWHISANLIGTRFLISGPLAVEIFFAISGFYMSLILTKKYRSTRVFYVNRFLRLYPTYAIVLVATLGWFAISWLYLGHAPQTSWPALLAGLDPLGVAAISFINLTMIGLDVPRLFGLEDLVIVPQSWSIGMEVWFYALAPTLIRLRTKWLITIGLASLALRVWIGFGNSEAYFFFPAQLCFFLCGILLQRYSSALASSITGGWAYRHRLRQHSVFGLSIVANQHCLVGGLQHLSSRYSIFVRVDKAPHTGRPHRHTQPSRAGAPQHIAYVV